MMEVYIALALQLFISAKLNGIGLETTPKFQMPVYRHRSRARCRDDLVVFLSLVTVTTAWWLLQIQCLVCFDAFIA